jgi:hypothetical protein
MLGPILAQLVTLGVSDRTEVRHIVTDDSYSEVATYPHVGINVGWKNATLAFGYAPSLTLTPLEAKDPSLVVYHSGAVAVSNRWQRTTVTASEVFGYGKVDFQSQALAAPGSAPVTSPPDTTGPPTTGTTTTMPTNGGTPTGTPGTGTQPQTTNTALANQFRATNAVLPFASSVTTVGFTQLVSAVLTLSGGVSYQVSGDPTNQNDIVYPVVKGPGARLAAAYTPTHYDTVTTSASTQYAASVNSNDAWLVFANETWTHQLDRNTAASFGAGLSLTRNSQPGPLVYYSIYPNFVVGINHASLVGRSTLTVGLNASSAPFLDPVLAQVDPRISTSAFVSFTRDKFSSSLSGGTTLSLATSGDNGAFSAIFGAFGLRYALGTAASVDGGVRGTYQTFEGQTTIPLSLAIYAGITFGDIVPLNGTH